jgi:hypothetical protein
MRSATYYFVAIVRHVKQPPLGKLIMRVQNVQHGSTHHARGKNLLAFGETHVSVAAWGVRLNLRGACTHASWMPETKQNPETTRVPDDACSSDIFSSVARPMASYVRPDPTGANHSAMARGSMHVGTQQAGACGGNEMTTPDAPNPKERSRVTRGFDGWDTHPVAMRA